MSRHYIRLGLKSVIGQEQAIDELLVELAKTRSERTRRLGAIHNWDELKAEIARQALGEVAAESKGKFSLNDAYQRVKGKIGVHEIVDQDQEAPGKTIGVLYRRDGAQFGIVQNDLRLEAFYNDLLTGDERDALQKRFEDAFKGISVERALELMGGTVTREKQPDGTVVVRARIRGKVGG